MSARYGALPRGGRSGYVDFVFDDGWTIFLTSETGSRDFDTKNIQVFDVRLPKYYGDEYDMDLAMARRLRSLADEMHHCRKMRMPVVLHCNHGRTRSVICLGVYLMRYSAMLPATAAAALSSYFIVADDEDIAHHARPGERVRRALDAYAVFHP